MKELDYSDIYGTRVLVFLENKPQSNKYHQVLLSPEMYKAMTATICKPASESFPLERNEEGRFAPQIEMKEIKTSEEEYTFPDLPEAYSNVNDLCP